MNKNILIGLLVILIIVGGGYYVLKNALEAPSLPIAPSTTTTTTPPVATPTTLPDTTPAITLGAPIVVTNPSSSTSISTALVNGQVTARGISTTYYFDYGETTNLGSKTIAQDIGSSIYAISAPAYITGLRTNTTYYFRLSANNNFGTESGTIYTFKTNNNPLPKAATPSANTSSATNISRNGANVNGKVSPNGWQTNYWFEYGKDNKFGNTTSIKSITASTALTSTSTISESLSGLEPLTKYYFRLNVQNQFGTINGATLNFTTKK